MRQDEYKEWQSEAARLIADWRIGHRLPRIDEPKTSRWESRDRSESHTIHVWSGDAYSPEIHFQRIYDSIGEAISAESRRWKFQSPMFAQAFGKFFRPADGAYPFNAVLVTPTRVPMRYWAQSGRQPMLERKDRWGPIPRRSFTLGHLSTPLELGLDDIAWADFEYRHRTRAKPMKMWTPRAWGPWDIRVLRLFQADTATSDMLAIEAGAVPAMRDPRIIGPSQGRVELSMVQMLRLKHDGEGDLVLFEVMHGCGLMVDIRASRQQFDSIVTPDPYFGPAIRGAIERGKNLCHL